MRCAVVTCNVDNQSKNYNRDLMFFHFPKDDNLSKQWLQACKRDHKVNILNARICPLHFDKENYERNLKEELLGLTLNKRQRLLKPDAIPTLNLPKQMESLKDGYKRNDRQLKRQATKLIKIMLDMGK
ncbi:hypothetical protein NQ314_004915 [Rhamnusium bicolor]|uniref:THAP-type domain-containing protein n=1 Tax=Rhamnusium bicolor TaxID=1586634 RepID=A0AAV8ZK06_9CUCU|nr:hypothetical protein NQ314_004915 [Rhamnusium bicolor]